MRQRRGKYWGERMKEDERETDWGAETDWRGRREGCKREEEVRANAEVKKCGRKEEKKAELTCSSGVGYRHWDWGGGGSGMKLKEEEMSVKRVWMEVKREDRMGGGTIRGGQGEPRLKKIFMKLFKWNNLLRAQTTSHWERLIYETLKDCFTFLSLLYTVF